MVAPRTLTATVDIRIVCALPLVLEILFIRAFKTAINEFIVMFPSIMNFKIAKAIVSVDQADAHLTGLWAALKSLLELLLDLSKSLNYYGS